MIRNYPEHSSNERTFLAWVRTTVAVVGFGIAGARLEAAASSSGSLPPGWPDALVLAAGALVVALAYLRMRAIRRRIDSERTADDAAGPADALLALLVIAFFALLGSFALRLTI